MPFTLAHPAYAFPLKYISPKYYSLTGLVLGSMAPDFEYFYHLEPYQSIGHSIWGLCIQAIPICILLAVIFHYIVKESLALHLPSLFNMNQRAYNILGEWKLNSFNAWIIFLSSVIVGFISHVTTDAFTHAGGLFVVHFSSLREVIIFNLPNYKMLQYGLSFIGLFAILGVVIYYLNSSNPRAEGMPKITRRNKLLFWIYIITTSVVITSAKIVVSDSPNIIGILVVAPISGLCLGLVLSSLLMRMAR
ncbi:DUF4184 family protein [Paenibacillus sp. LMG 31456]|uniref:DUF4184 family protein n=1 Tax=Paenibacillus foliorum TaxID=2654974 RepID=A0A972GKC3_9BACL|nr:DUF4184 family protein [Paenibacillus foliorum]NOU91918.1 DUF4184 family protein [Paenibacillus foliorum]